MKVIICLDYSKYTEKVLQAVRLLLGTRVPRPNVWVLHVIDQSVLTMATGDKLTQVHEELKNDSAAVYKFAKEYLDEGFQYKEETGLPQAEIMKTLDSTDYDLLVVGTRGRSIVSNVLLGSVSEYLLHHVKKPLLIVPW